MRERLSARFSLSVSDAPLVRDALMPEVRSSPGVSLILRKGALDLRLRAATPSSLRSQVNAWLRLVEVAADAAAVASPNRARKV